MTLKDSLCVLDRWAGGCCITRDLQGSWDHFCHALPRVGWFDGLMGAGREQHARYSFLTGLQMMALSLVLIQQTCPKGAWPEIIPLSVSLPHPLLRLHAAGEAAAQDTNKSLQGHGHQGARGSPCETRVGLLEIEERGGPKKGGIHTEEEGAQGRVRLHGGRPPAQQFERAAGRPAGPGQVDGSGPGRGERA